MKGRTVRAQLRLACEEVEEACAGEVAPEVRAQLQGIAEQLRHAVDGASEDPEAVVLPERGALDTMQRRLTDVLETADEAEIAAGLRRAREAIILAILTLEDRWQRQHEPPSGER